jgi:hypothetical protein
MKKMLRDNLGSTKTWWSAPNAFFDLSFNEFAEQRLMKTPPPTITPPTTTMVQSRRGLRNTDVNWVTAGMVPPIRDQVANLRLSLSCLTTSVLMLILSILGRLRVLLGLCCHRIHRVTLPHQRQGLLNQRPHPLRAANRFLCQRGYWLWIRRLQWRLAS